MSKEPSSIGEPSGSLHAFLARHARQTPDAIAIIAPGRTPLSYRLFDRQVDDVGAQLHDFGLRRGDRVALALPDGPELAVAEVALAAWVTCVPLNPDLHPQEIERLLARIDCRAILVPAGSTVATAALGPHGPAVIDLIPSPDRAAGLFTLRARHVASLSGANGQPTVRSPGTRAAADEVAVILATSGTSAQPKLVPLTHQNIATAAVSIGEAVDLSPRDRCVCVMPLYHIHGMSAVAASIVAGASAICSGAFNPADFFAAMDQWDPTWYTAAPTIHRAILEAAQHRDDVVRRARLRFVRSASAACPESLVTEIERLFGAPFIEAYGMTEAAPQIASNRIGPHLRVRGSVGPAAGPEIAIMDDAGNPLPVGSEGEVLIRGPNVTSGYLDDPDANHAAFVRGWLRTGDRGRLDVEGRLYLTGRVKEIINRGGEKISPHEVDQVLRAHPAVAEAVSFPVAHPTLGEDLAVAIVLKGGEAVEEDSDRGRQVAQEIRRFASTRLAHFKVPQTIRIVDAIPVGSTGKVARNDLPRVLPPRRAASGNGVARQLSPLESRVADMWAAVLPSRPGRHDNFFQVGGDSLRAAQVVARLGREYSIALPANIVFESPTVAELARAVSDRLASGGAELADRPTARERTGQGFPLSFAQQRLWLLDQVEPGNPAYNMAVALRMSGPLREDVLERSLGEIVRRHESLRTVFRDVGGHPTQVVTPMTPFHLAVVDLTGSPGANREAEAERLAAEEAACPFHLVHGPLFRATLFRIGAETHLLLLSMHHIVSDGWSTGVLLRELATLYAGFGAGRASPLPELPLQYGDFALWQRDRMTDKGRLDSHLGYWKEQLAGAAPLLDVPTDRPRPDTASSRGASHRRVVPSDVTTAIDALSTRENVTPFMTLLAAFQVLLHRYSALTDIVVGTPIANRSSLETEDLIGFFANTLALRTNLAGAPTFRELLGRVRSVATDAYAHQDLPFERLVEELRPTRDPGYAPICQVMFAFQNLPSRFAEGHWADLTVTSIDIDRHAAKFDLTLYLSADDDGLRATWQYRTDLFDSGTIARMAENFETLLRSIVANPDGQIGTLPLLGNAERAIAAATWNRPATTPDDGRCFHQMFEAQAHVTPDAKALTAGGETLSYAELNRRADRLACRLRRMGIGPDRLVGICLPRSVDMVVATLAVMKAGGAYLPLDPSYPSEHLAFVLRDADVALLITDEAFGPTLPTDRVPLLLTSGFAQADEPDGDDSPSAHVAASNLAYVIYTSGSTGQPKGVMVTHGNLSSYVQAMVRALGVGADDSYLATASFAFSSSVRQLTVPLSCGAHVVVASTETTHNPEALFELIRRERISILDIVPSYWRSCNRLLASLSPDARVALLTNRLRLILSASEPLSADVPRQWREVSQHGARLINMFGQTETTGIVTFHPLSARDAEGPGLVPIGRPIAHTRTYVLDPLGQPVPVGVWGELFVGGPGVGRGYLNDAALTDRKFVIDSLGGEADGRLYRTGDMTRYRPDGALEFRGRADQLVKIRGHRIEPAQIEAIVERHGAWRECAVTTLDEGEKRLVAYVVPARGAQSSVRDLREYLRRSLPAYMVPTQVIIAERLPRTPNGKLDRSALNRRPPTAAPAVEADGLGAGVASRESAAGLASTSSVQETLVSIWTELLGVARVDRDDNFFDLGGNSLLAIDMIARVRQAGFHLTPQQLWLHQTIGDLAPVVEGQSAAPKASMHSHQAETASGEPVRRPAPAAPVEPARRIRVTIDSLRAYGREALERAGLMPEGAAIVTEVQLEASLRDQPTHNMVSIPRYARRIGAGAINPRPNIRVERQTGTSALIDGDNGPGQWVAVVAMETAIGLARHHGVGVVGVRRSNHLGAAGHYPWLAARQGYIGLCTTNGPVILAPTGGITPTFGNNPLGVGIPAASYHPILLDIAMSVAPRGRIGLHLAEGKPLPEGWILDQNGNPSTDPVDLVAGLGVPIGGHKGYGLTLIMEVLAGVLTGANFGWDNRRDHSPGMVKPAGFGHFFMAIDPEMFLPRADFTARVDRMIHQAKSGERAPGVAEILVPGEAELTARDRSLREGVPLRAYTVQALRKYARAADLRTELVVVPIESLARSDGD